jgi:hypothetical protein
MTLGAHLLAGWLLAYSFRLAQRERRIVACASIAPDLDGVGWLIDRFNTQLNISTDFYFQFHHVVGHNLLAGSAIATLALIFASKQKWRVFWLALGAAHLHLIGDVMGSKGPDGYQWPIAYLYPFTDRFQWIWSGQWELHAWQNSAITLGMLGMALYVGWRKNYSFVEVISARLDQEFFNMLARYGLKSK